VLKVSPWIMRWVEGQSLNSHKREDKYQYSYITHYHYNTRCDPKVLRRVFLKEYCALYLAADTVTT